MRPVTRRTAGTGAAGGTPPAGPAGGLRRQAARGAFVTLTGQVSRMVIQLAAVAVLARLLGPEDYGLIAMVVVVVGIGEIFRDFGLSSAAIQAPELSRTQRDNLVWVNTAIGLTLAAIVYLCAGLIAEAYDRPELIAVTQALAGTFVLNGIATQYRADLVRRLLLSRLAVVEIAAALAALVVAVLLAASGAGYWALVAQTLVQAATLLISMMVAARWLPRLPRRAPMGGLLRFGGRLVGTQLIGYASNNTDALLVGLRFGAGPLGIYNRAFHLVMTPLTQLRAPSTTVALPVLSRLQADVPRYSSFVLRGQVALGYTLVAGMGLVAAAAVPVTAVLLGPDWDAVAPLLRLIAAAGAFQTLSYVGYWIYLSRNLTADLLRYTLVSSAIRVACLCVGSIWGVQGVAAGYAVAAALEWPLSIGWLSRRTEIPARGLFVGALRILVCVTVASLAAAGTDAALDGGPAL
ncbi:MAG: lipopolysaccharide biosynthesis protein, partial [Actinotalea sp.]|nr:lipopolysaccharide biosynthesis protein [Actinotalea sp.]